MPDLSGTPGHIIDDPNLPLVFGKRLRVSPYDALLEDLSRAGKGKMLCFDDVKARASVTKRAQKLELRVAIAEHGGKLYVRFDGYAAGSERFKAEVRAELLDAIKTNPRTDVQCAVELRSRGLDQVDAALAGSILRQLEQESRVKRRGDGSWLVLV